jgi:osmotically-inducible protein OsmY
MPRLLTLIALAAVATGIYHYRNWGRLRDERLAKRVRAAISGAASTRVEVRVVNGAASLRGTLSKAERDQVLAAALAVPGVTRVRHLLDVDEAVGEIGTLQAGIATGI